MNTTQSECCISCDSVLNDGVIGVFAADRLPKHRLERRYGIIVNTDIHSNPGKHWCAIYNDGEGHIVFFDSFGRTPAQNSAHIMRWINKRVKTLEYNKMQLQSGQSNVCGLYSILFLRQQLLGMSLQEFVDEVNYSDLHINDMFVFRRFFTCLFTLYI